MHRRLTDEMIERAALGLLADHRHVTLRMLTAELQRLHGASGRNARVGRILREMSSRAPAEAAARLRVIELEKELKEALARAERAEVRETAHQDLWARRMAEQADALERRHQSALRARPDITLNQYLQLRQEHAAALRRLAEYEARETSESGRRDE